MTAEKRRPARTAETVINMQSATTLGRILHSWYASADSAPNQLIRTFCIDGMSDTLYEHHSDALSLSFLPHEITRSEQLDRYIQVATLAVGRIPS